MKNPGGEVSARARALAETEVIQGRTIYEASGESEKLIYVVHYPDAGMIRLSTLGRDGHKYTRFIRLSSLYEIDVGTT